MFNVFSLLYCGGLDNINFILTLKKKSNKTVTYCLKIR